MNQAGKPAEAARPDKRERRRGAAGRAAALRRAPSDSDCSGETASLSADSGDRAPRPAPLAPPRSGKTRSRRRGSEWEVLEGLKDGQRFEKRPDVYNGYLHKKRKWPLKGWHKRFFVIDAGILVYARSPTDVARGRLHGSVDVGLSVISAKARRRRIDIDADEFIYHLRAKTPDVFRTWLNVLKAHRLYRQHLLTFGARESIPKIQGPLEDLPATDTSSRTSNDASNTKPEYLSSPLPTLPIDLESSEYTNKDKSSIFQWQLEIFPENSLITLNIPVEQDFNDKYEDSITQNRRSICSTKYLSKDYKAISNINKKSSHSSATTLKGKQSIGTDLEFNSFENVTVLKQCILNATEDRLPNFDEPLKSEKSHKKNHSLFFKQQESTTVRCFLTHWKKQEYYGTEIRRSRKCTNLPKYRNESQEPPLDIMSSSKCLLLGKYRLTEPNQAFTVKTTNKAVGCKTTRTQNIKVQVKLDQKNSEKNISTISIDKDEITNNVIVSILNQNKIATEEDIKYCLDHVFKDLYDNHLNYKLQPVKNLFRNLLEYWLKNKTVAKYKEVMNCDKCINNQSERHFTRDKNISGLYLEMNSKETQCDVLKVPSTNHKNDVSSWEKRNSGLKLNSSCSFRYEKESQEKLLKNTVYVCEKTEKSTSKGINTYEITATEEIDPGKEYLKDILSAMCPNIKKIENTTDSHNIPKLHKNTVESKHFDAVKNDLRRSLYRKDRNDLVYENYEDNSLVIDITKYNIENISVFNDPQLKGLMSITIKLKEKYVEAKPTHLNLTFSDDSKYMTTDIGDSVSWLSFLNHDVTASDGLFTIVHKNSDMGFSINSDTDDLKPYISSDGTSKTHIVNESDSLFGKTVNRNYNINNISGLNEKASEEPQACYIVSFKKENTAKLPPQKETKISECLIKSRVSPNQSPGPSKPYKSEVQEAVPRIIDEKFILLLLENLTLLSKNVPSLHKDLETFYLKLKKRHEKMVKKCNIVQGLSLLGKIYRKDLCIKDSDDQESFDPDDANKQREFKTAATNTETHEVENKSVYACISRTAIDSDVLSTDNIDRKTNGKVEANLPISCKEIMQPRTIDVEATLSPIPIRKKNAINTDAKCILNENTGKVPIEIARDSFKKKRNSQKMRRELIKEISLLSPSNKVSTQSIVQQEITSDHKPFDKDFHVCRLFGNYKYKVKRTHSTNVSSSEDTTSDEMRTLYRCPSDPSFSGLYSPTTPTLRGPQACFVSGTPGGRLAGWIIESGGPLETASRELGQAQLSVQQLQRLLDALDTHHQLHHDTDVSVDGASPNVKKDRRKFGLRKKKSNSKCASVELAPPHIDPSSSHTALSSLSALTAPPSPGGGASSIPNSAASLPIACAAARPQSLPGAESLNTVQGAGPASLTSLTPDHQLREDFTVLAKDLVASLKGIVSTMVCERGRLRAAMEAAESSPSPAGAVVAALRTNLNSALQQNSELRSRLSRIHDTSDIADITAVHNDAVNRHMQQSLSFSSSCVSASEFFDAEEHEEDDDLKPDDVIAADEAGVIELDGDSSSEAGSLSSEEGSASSDNSDGAMVSAEQALRQNGGAVWTRRTRLPAPRPEPGGPSLWNLLYKNIGKDLSQISMPVTINEPLNMLQRLCEELEYSELLDSAAECTSAMERMSLIAAFAVSAYAASAHRAASKPFNPLLAETYECVRDDRGFRFLAEQVSHHPPISACHAESSRWCFWQEARIKTKFWGKSMEFQPTGRVHVRLNTTGDHYTWNKVTTCVHNLFGGQRWVDQYGDMHIVCVGTDLSCKLNFVKASSWSQSRHEVRGAVTCGGARLRVAGRWSEALYVGEPPAARCLWRPGAMPPEHELYYGFTRFAMELNELEPGMKDVLPHTDTRLRPDQRALEEGDVETAEQLKHSLEQAQRDRRRESPAHSPAWFRKTIEEGEETWVFSGEYWKARAAGFSDDIAPRIW